MFNIFNTIIDLFVTVPPFELLRYAPPGFGQADRYGIYRAAYLFGKFQISEMMWNFGNGFNDSEEGWVDTKLIGNVDLTRYRVLAEIQEVETTVNFLKQASKPFQRGQLIRKLDI